MSTAMDLFLNSNDSLPFPDVLDIDIKSETDTLVGNVNNDFSGFNFHDLQPIEFEDIHDIRWFSSNSNQSNLDFSGEDGPTMVNPNAVMPIMNSTQSPSPASFKESHLTFSPATIKISSFKKDTTTVKQDLIAKLEGIGDKKEDIIKNRILKIEPIHNSILEHKKPVPSPQIKTVPKVTPILAKQSVRVGTVKPLLAKTNSNSKAVEHGDIKILFKNAVRHVGSPQLVTPIITHVRTIAAQNALNRKQLIAPNLVSYDDEELQIFPKPAYSYSCLIAMALKNSRSGCLPVSEIYNFMCRHFPYFKTAPNGWKNSVRHNLSLNKCFEKIEKPAVNGAQRKGCLWAMNPAKISKMDEEVQKWSRKDPHAIKRAMVHPDNLEALERGELKFYGNDEGDNLDSCGSAESEASESEPEQETEQEREVDFADAATQYQFIQIKEDDVEVTEEIYSDEIEDDKELLRREMVLAQKELYDQYTGDYQRTINNKRRRMYIVQN